MPTQRIYEKLFSLLALAFILPVVGIHSAHAASKTTFENWLQEYGAWDRLEQEYAKETNSDSPDVILKRAEVYLNLNSPHKALELVEMTSTFADNATEAERLWIGGQAHRALGDLSKAVLWFTQASKFMPDPVKNGKIQKRTRIADRMEGCMAQNVLGICSQSLILQRSTERSVGKHFGYRPECLGWYILGKGQCSPESFY